MSGFALEEIIDFIGQELTIGCSLPKQLPDTEIRRIIETKALPWFYQNYMFAVQKAYYFVAEAAFSTEEFTRYRSIDLPCEIQSIPYIYEVRGESLFQLGINTPNLSVNLGVTNQPYLSSYVTTIGELGVYKTILDSMSDMLNQLNKYTVKYHYNQLAHRLHILTNVKYNLILECYVNIENEKLFRDPYFIKWVTGASKVQLGNMVGRYDFTLPGGIKYNYSDLISQGKEEMKEVEDEIKNMSNSSFFFLVKK